jgi:hypothetical protein
MFAQPGNRSSEATFNTARLKTAQARWGRLTAADYLEVETIAQLVAKVAERYALPHAQAQRDVEIWAKEMRL